jgi:hypothetical protein
VHLFSDVIKWINRFGAAAIIPSTHRLLRWTPIWKGLPDGITKLFFDIVRSGDFTPFLPAGLCRNEPAGKDI